MLFYKQLQELRDIGKIRAQKIFNLRSTPNTTATTTTSAAITSNNMTSTLKSCYDLEDTIGMTKWQIKRFLKNNIELCLNMGE